MKKISLIGSTGSIGRQVVEVVKNHPDEYKIVGVAAFGDRETFARQTELLKPEICALASEDFEKALSVAEYGDIVFNAAGGFAGLAYSLRAVKAKKTLALANKETLVCGGDIVMPLAEKLGVNILPVDSEHSAIWQCLNFDRKAAVRRLIITASGGAFRDLPPEKLDAVTPEQALAHPTWKMGKKITVDSATLMNKGYEVIEANMLYGTPYADIETVIQPQSIIHSLVEFTDGAVLAQLSYPTMLVPIQLALSYPKRLDLAVEPMNFKKTFALDFRPLEREKYPCFDLALRCGEGGGILPCALNAADEEGVKAFLAGKIKFTDIYRVANGVIQSTENERAGSYARLEEVDRVARIKAQKIIESL